MLIAGRTFIVHGLSSFLRQVPDADVVGAVRGCDGAVAQAQLLAVQVVLLEFTIKKNTTVVMQEMKA